METRAWRNELFRNNPTGLMPRFNRSANDEFNLLMLDGERPESGLGTDEAPPDHNPIGFMPDMVNGPLPSFREIRHGA